MEKLKIALVIGHTSNGDKGAYSPYLNKSEYDYNLAVAKELKEIQAEGIEYTIYTHTIQGYNSRQTALANKLNKLGFDYVLELHFNAASPQANGTECLHYFSSKKGKHAAQTISMQISKDFGTTIRGDKGAKALINANDRGFGFVSKQKSVAVIVEPFFGSNKESEKFLDISKYACSLQNALKSLRLP